MTVDVPSESWRDEQRLMRLISQMMPEFNLEGYRDQIEDPKVRLIMFSSVQTEPHLDEKNVMQRRPSLPLESTGFEPFLKAIQEAYACVGIEKTRNDEKWGWVLPLLAIGVLLLVIMVVYHVCKQPEWVTCKPCEGTGRRAVVFTCKPCDGTGKVPLH
jgi:hypothetical protein